jgi:hypothetical protein
MRWREGVGITLEEFESVFVSVFGPFREEGDLIERLENLDISSGDAAKHVAKLITGNQFILSHLKGFHPQTPPFTVVVYTPPQPTRSINRGELRFAACFPSLIETPDESDESDEHPLSCYSLTC